MSYQEHKIQFGDLPKYIALLDSDEGIRVNNSNERIFVNRIARKYTVMILKDSIEEFFYFYDPIQVLNFIKNNIKNESEFFLY